MPFLLLTKNTISTLVIIELFNFYFAMFYPFWAAHKKMEIKEISCIMFS